MLVLDQTMKATFQKQLYEVVFTDHAKLQMILRSLEEKEVIGVIETGEVKAKGSPGKFWVFKELEGRNDNMISVSISLEASNLIVITTMVNWSPK